MFDRIHDCPACNRSCSICRFRLARHDSPGNETTRHSRAGRGKTGKFFDSARRARQGIAARGSSGSACGPRPAAHERTRTHRPRPDAHRGAGASAVFAALRRRDVLPCDAGRRDSRRHRSSRRFGLRDFDRQLLLPWNRKWRGERPLHDREGRLLDPARLDDAGRVQAILCWSAIPGSRHHWGTDVDVIDAAAMPPGYQV